MMVEKRCITFAGLPCVGKKTLIRKLESGGMAGNHEEREGLRSRFGVAGSTKGYGPSFNECRIPAEEIWERVAGAQVDTILYQWQSVEHRFVGKMLDTFPDRRHRAFLLWAPYDLLLERICTERPKLKVAWEESGTRAPDPGGPVTIEKLAASWRHDVLGQFAEFMGSRLEVVVVDSTTPGFPLLPPDVSGI